MLGALGKAQSTFGGGDAKGFLGKSGKRTMSVGGAPTHDVFKKRESKSDPSGPSGAGAVAPAASAASVKEDYKAILEELSEEVPSMPSPIHHYDAHCGTQHACVLCRASPYPSLGP